VRSTALRAVHVCIDDHSRIAFSQILPDERKKSATAFLKAAVAYYQSLGVTVERVMTDNGSCYWSKDFTKACKLAFCRFGGHRDKVFQGIGGS